MKTHFEGWTIYGVSLRNDWYIYKKKKMYLFVSKIYIFFIKTFWIPKIYLFMYSILCGFYVLDCLSVVVLTIYLFNLYYLFIFFFQIKSNHFYCHITTAQVPWWVKFLWACSRQCKKTKQKNPTIYIWTVHIYRLYRRQCTKYTYIYSVHIVYYKDILNYQLHIIHRMCTSTLCTLSIHNVVYA